MSSIHKIEALEVSAEMMGGVDTIYPTLIWDQVDVILVDTGYPGQMPLIRKEVEIAGAKWAKLNKIIITHQDLDHIGSLPMIRQEQPDSIEVYANAQEKPYIQGDKRLVKITKESIELAMRSIPDNVPTEWRKAFQHTLENPPSSKVDYTVEDREELPFCGGIVIINTPGHTPGHISLYHKSSKTLIAGDALIVEDGQLSRPKPEHCIDYKKALQSIQTFTDLDIETVICYHGGVFNHQVNQRLQELTELSR